MTRGACVSRRDPLHSLLRLRTILNFMEPMVLCICQAVTDREVDAAILQGARSVAAVSRACGAARGCGCCTTAIERRIERVCRNDCADCPRRTGELASASL